MPALNLGNEIGSLKIIQAAIHIELLQILIIYLQGPVKHLGRHALALANLRQNILAGRIQSVLRLHDARPNHHGTMVWKNNSDLLRTQQVGEDEGDENVLNEHVGPVPILLIEHLLYYRLLQIGPLRRDKEVGDSQQE